MADILSRTEPSDPPVRKQPIDASPPEQPASIVVLCPVPRDFDADSLAEALIRQSLAACVQIGPDIKSIYRWEGEVEKSLERLLIIKTRAVLFARLERMIRAAHPYEVPEIIALPISAGHAPYLNWIAEMTAGVGSPGEGASPTSPQTDSPPE